MTMTMTLGFDVELLFTKSGFIFSTPFKSLSDSVGGDGGGFLVEVRSDPNNSAYFACNSASGYAWAAEKEGCLLQHPDFATGCHIHLNTSKYIEERPTLLIQLGELLESRARSDSPYSALRNYNREKEYGTEFRMLPSAILALPFTFEESVKYLRLWSCLIELGDRQDHTLPRSLERKIRRLNFGNRIVSRRYYEVSFEFDYEGDPITAPAPVVIHTLHESMGSVIKASPEVIASETLLGLPIMRSRTSLRIGLPHNTNWSIIDDIISAIRAEVRDAVITERSLEDLDIEIASFIRAKRAELRGRVRVRRKKREKGNIDIDIDID